MVLATIASISSIFSALLSIREIIDDEWRHGEPFPESFKNDIMRSIDGALNQKKDLLDVINNLNSINLLYADAHGKRMHFDKALELCETGEGQAISNNPVQSASFWNAQRTMTVGPIDDLKTNLVYSLDYKKFQTDDEFNKILAAQTANLKDKMSMVLIFHTNKMDDYKDYKQRLENLKNSLMPIENSLKNIFESCIAKLGE